ncbi:MAG TPA: hypothetical protein VFK73_09335, partial [Paludibacter sp.]|nr:hypothetical protein [Paludibacter sp.]
EVAQYTDNEIESMIDGFMADVEIKEKEIVESDAALTPPSGGGGQAMKEYPLVWREILAGMTDEKNTIPEIAANSKLAGELVTFHLMTMNRYGVVVPAGMDAKETYYYYKRK